MQRAPKNHSEPTNFDLTGEKFRTVVFISRMLERVTVVVVCLCVSITHFEKTAFILTFETCINAK